MIENVMPGRKFAPKAADENLIRESARAFHSNKRKQGRAEVIVKGGTVVKINNDTSATTLRRGNLVPLFDLAYSRASDSTSSEVVERQQGYEEEVKWQAERGRIVFTLTDDHIDTTNLQENFCVPIGVIVGDDISPGYSGDVLIDGCWMADFRPSDTYYSGIDLDNYFPYAGVVSPPYMDFGDATSANQFIRPNDIAFCDANWFYGGGYWPRVVLGTYGRINILHQKVRSANALTLFRLDNWRNMNPHVLVDTSDDAWEWSGIGLRTTFNSTAAVTPLAANTAYYQNAYPPELYTFLQNAGKVISPLVKTLGGTVTGGTTLETERQRDYHGAQRIPIILVPHRRRWEVALPMRVFYAGWASQHAPGGVSTYRVNIEMSGYYSDIGPTLAHPWLCQYKWTQGTTTLVNGDTVPIYYDGPVYVEYQKLTRQWGGASNADYGNGNPAYRLVGVGNRNFTIV